jgi:predicted small metal-binding protein
MFRELTDWSVVEPNGFPDYRYNDHEIVRAFCDHAAATHDFLVEHGVVFFDQAPDARGGNAVGNSVPREMHCAAMDWPMVQTGKPVDPAVRATTSTGNGMMRPLEIAACKLGVELMLRHPEPPHVDVAAGFFFRADSIAELARKIVMQYQRVKMPPENLEQTVARYNSFVESGVDADFGKPTLLYKIATPPFCAAWATPVVHDTVPGCASTRTAR